MGLKFAEKLIKCGFALSMLDLCIRCTVIINLQDVKLILKLSMAIF